LRSKRVEQTLNNTSRRARGRSTRRRRPPPSYCAPYKSLPAHLRAEVRKALGS